MKKYTIYIKVSGGSISKVRVDGKKVLLGLLKRRCLLEWIKSLERKKLI